MGRNQWVVRSGGGWAVRGERSGQITSKHRTQAAAIDAATSIARGQKSEVIIQGMDGKIRDRDSYGSDPFPPKDTKH
jgi:hypothetical protein